MATAPLPYEYEPIPVAAPGGLLASAVGTPLQPQPPIPPAEPLAPPAFAMAPEAYENDDVISSLNAITAADSGYMQLARTSGLSTAHKRGLLNTSIAAGTSQAAAISAAAPLAMQNASQASARNLARLQARFTKEQQGIDIAARERMLAAQLRSEEERLGRQLTSQEFMQMRDISNRLTMQGIDLTAQRQMQQSQLAATERIAKLNIEAEMARLGRTLTAQEQAQIRDLSAQQARLQTSLAMQKELTTMTEAGATDRANLDAATRTQLLAMENASQEDIATLNYYLAQDQIYATAVSNLYANAEMPAPARDAAMNQFLTLKNSNLDLPAVLFGTDLQWVPDPLPPPPPSPPYGGPGTTTGGANPLSSDGIPNNDGVQHIGGVIVGPEQ